MEDVLEYFAEMHDYFWVTEEDTNNTEKVWISVNEGSTIVYIDLLIEYIDLLSIQGLPPFGALLLAIAATNPMPEGALNNIKKIVIQKNESDNDTHATHRSIISAFQFLFKLASIPEKYKQGENRKRLLQSIFGDCHYKYALPKSKRIISDAKKMLSAKEWIFTRTHFAPNRLVKDFRTIALLNARFPTIEKILASIENLPDKQTISENITDEIHTKEVKDDKPKDFIAAMLENPNTFPIGSLIKRLWSGLQIPYHENIPSGQPLGGIADITNKGDFSKLLLSEFANDDITFMTRIANNEALYIEREMPPINDKIERYFLIDITIKNWGTPKILAFAASIAIARHPRSEMNYHYYLIGKEATPIALDNIDDIILGSYQVEALLDATIGIEDFFHKTPISGSAEVFLLSHSAVLQSSEMQKVMAKYADKIRFLITAQPEGIIDVYKYSSGTKRYLQRLFLDLEKLWATPPESKTNRFDAKNTAVNDSTPLLYAVQKSYTNIMYSGEEWYNYINGRLYRFVTDDGSKGLELIADNLRLDYMQSIMYLDKNGDLIIACLSYNYQSLYLYNIQKQTTTHINLENALLIKGNFSLFYDKDSFYLCSAETVYRISGKNYIYIHEQTENIKNNFYSHLQKIETFILSYKKHKKKYQAINAINSFSYNNSKMIINNCLIQSDKLVSTKYTFSGTTRITTKVNLILKKVGENKLSVVKVLKDELNIELKAAKELVDSSEENVLAENIDEKFAEKLKEKIEATGAVCYYKKTYVETTDGSTIKCQHGTLIFESSNKDIPIFYIPFIPNISIAFATNHEFCGNDYFLPINKKLTVIDNADFYAKYIQAFLDNIIQHGTEVNT